MSSDLVGAEPQNQKARRRARRAREPNTSQAQYFAELKAREAEALADPAAAHADRPINPGVRVERKAGGRTVWTAPHSDFDAWELQLREAFGTRSRAVIQAFMDGLVQLTGNGWDPEPRALNAALGIVNSMRPKNEGEAMLAAHMVASHLLTMKAGAMANQYSSHVDDRQAKTFAKVGRLFVDQLELMSRLKGHTRTQRIEVTYNDNRQQVAGGVHVYRGGAEIGGQPQEPRPVYGRENHGSAAIEHAERPALPRSDAGGWPLPGASGEEPTALQGSWLRSWLRRAFG